MKFSVIAITLAQAACITAAPRRCRAPKSSLTPEASAAPAGEAPYPSALALSSSAPVFKPSAVVPVASAAASSVVNYAASSAAPAASAAPSKAPSYGGSPSSGGKPWIDSINEYRVKAKLPLFTWDDKLAGNCKKTGQDAGGNQLKHELNPGSYGQVMVYGFDDADKCTKDTKKWTSFEIFFYSWMCERSEDPALGGICQQIWDIGHIADGGQTGHHDILASPDYKTIGCAFVRDPAKAKCDSFPGIWVCDVGY